MSSVLDDLLTLLAEAPAPVAVVGTGALADELRAVVPPPGSDTKPPTVVETSGTREGVIAALELVADLGVVVLAGPLSEPSMDLDLYPDLHVRGITVAALPPGGAPAD